VAQTQKKKKGKCDTLMGHKIRIYCSGAALGHPYVMPFLRLLLLLPMSVLVPVRHPVC
jgi:hypothetical protein